MKIDINNQEQLREMREQFFPCGSGPLSVMRMVCRLIDAIAEEKNFNVGQKEHPLERNSV